MNKILIITPTYNEIANIKQFTDAILSINEEFHMLVVDDSSPDGTGDFIKSHLQFNQRLFLLFSFIAASYIFWNLGLS